MNKIYIIYVATRIPDAFNAAGTDFSSLNPIAVNKGPVIMVKPIIDSNTATAKKPIILVRKKTARAEKIKNTGARRDGTWSLAKKDGASEIW
jgi:hypothetical protein